MQALSTIASKFVCLISQCWILTCSDITSDKKCYQHARCKSIHIFLLSIYYRFVSLNFFLFQLCQKLIMTDKLRLKLIEFDGYRNNTITMAAILSQLVACCSRMQLINHCIWTGDIGIEWSWIRREFNGERRLEVDRGTYEPMFISSTWLITG